MEIENLVLTVCRGFVIVCSAGARVPISIIRRAKPPAPSVRIKQHACIVVTELTTLYKTYFYVMAQVVATLWKPAHLPR